MFNVSEIEHALFMFTRSLEKYKNMQALTLETYSTGLPFYQMLNSISYFNLNTKQIDQNAQKVSQKLSNLKKIMTKMQNYVYNETKKTLKTNDIQLIQIAKNVSREDILKFFEVVIAVLMQTPQKQDHIQQIMELDERSQQALVIVVQNAMEYRICQASQNNKFGNGNIINKIESIQNQNHILREQINQLCLQNDILLKQNNQLKQKILQCEEQFDKAKNLNIKMYMNSDHTERPQSNIVQMLKSKMINMTRQHELQKSKFCQQIDYLKSKIIQLKDLQEQFNQKQKRFQQKLKSQILNTNLGKKRSQQKQIKIKKLQYQLDISKNKIRQLSENLQVNDLNLRMELQKKQIRFKQLEKQVKNKSSSNNFQSNSKKNIIEDKIEDQRQNNQNEIQYLKSQVQKLRTSNCQYQKQNLKLKKKSQKIQIMENQKKKLQKVILDVSKNRDSQIQMLVVSLYDLRNQNIRMHQIITQLKNRKQVN